MVNKVPLEEVGRVGVFEVIKERALDVKIQSNKQKVNQIGQKYFENKMRINFGIGIAFQSTSLLFMEKWGVFEDTIIGHNSMRECKRK